MDPMQALMMAANGHAGLPPTIHPGGLPPTGGPPVGGPAPGPPSGNGQGAGQDKQVAQATEQALLKAAQAVNDPELKSVFSQCLAALHKYLAMDQKEHQQALQGKLSPRLMGRAYSA